MVEGRVDLPRRYARWHPARLHQGLRADWGRQGYKSKRCAEAFEREWSDSAPFEPDTDTANSVRSTRECSPHWVGCRYEEDAMLDKLSRLGATPADVSGELTAARLKSLEAATGVLPEDYTNLLLHFGGDIEFSAIVAYRPDVPSPWTSDDGRDTLEMLYGLESKYGLSVLEMYNRYRTRIPTGWIPIGAAPGGNQICLYIRDRASAHVGFWDHGSEVAPGLSPRSDGLTSIAVSLQNFVDRLTPEKPSTNVPDDVKVDLRF